MSMASSTTQQETCLTALPTELLAALFEHLGLEDCFCLCLVSGRLWSIGLPFMEKRLTERMGGWAGTRIVCVPSRYRSLEVSQGILTAEEMEVLKQGLRKDEWKLHEPDEEFRPRKVGISEIARHRFQSASPDAMPRSLFREAVAQDTVDNLPKAFRLEVQNIFGRETWSRSTIQTMRNGSSATCRRTSTYELTGSVGRSTGQCHVSADLISDILALAKLSSVESDATIQAITGLRSRERG